MSINNFAPYAAGELDPKPVEQLLANHSDESFSFVELVLYASEFSEDELEVGDLVDAMLESNWFRLKALHEDHATSA